MTTLRLCLAFGVVLALTCAASANMQDKEKQDAPDKAKQGVQSRLVKGEVAASVKVVWCRCFHLKPGEMVSLLCLVNHPQHKLPWLTVFGPFEILPVAQFEAPPDQPGKIKYASLLLRMTYTQALRLTYFQEEGIVLPVRTRHLQNVIGIGTFLVRCGSFLRQHHQKQDAPDKAKQGGQSRLGKGEVAVTVRVPKWCIRISGLRRLGETGSILHIFKHPDTDSLRLDVYHHLQVLPISNFEGPPPENKKMQYDRILLRMTYKEALRMTQFQSTGTNFLVRTRHLQNVIGIGTFLVRCGSFLIAQEEKPHRLKKGEVGHLIPGSDAYRFRPGEKVSVLCLFKNPRNKLIVIAGLCHHVEVLGYSSFEGPQQVRLRLTYEQSLRLHYFQEHGKVFLVRSKRLQNAMALCWLVVRCGSFLSQQPVP